MITWYLPPPGAPAGWPWAARRDNPEGFIRDTRAFIARLDAELAAGEQAAADMTWVEQELARPEPDVMRLLEIMHRYGGGGLPAWRRSSTVTGRPAPTPGIRGTAARW